MSDQVIGTANLTSVSQYDPSGRPLVSGRYLAENGRWFVQIRVEAGADGCVTVSSDLQSRDGAGPIDLWMKTRGPAASGGRSWPADWRDGGGGTASGALTLEPVDDHLLEATFTIEESLAGLVPGFTLTVSAAWVSTAFRDVGLEIEQEAGLDLKLEALRRNKDVVDVIDALKVAGLRVHDVGKQSIIGRPRNGAWSASNAFTALNEQARLAAQAPLTTPAWELHLLLLSQSERDGLLGVMFDFVDDLPRQGAAVFVNEIRKRYPGDEVPRRVLATALHELGHCLNLTHRFAREVGRPDSTSCMNYDWMYRGSEEPPPSGTSDRSAAYWKSFDFTFDPDELTFLRHASRDQVIPGGAPFGSARYWISGGGVAGPAIPSLPGLQLWLTPPISGSKFRYGEPVFLEVSLRNATDAVACIPRHILDVKAGALDVLIRRLPGRSALAKPGDPAAFAPFMRRCFASAPDDRLPLRPGESLHDNVALTFGSAGSPFVEPGRYGIQPVLTFYDEASGDIEGVVEGAELVISIGAPTSTAEERDAGLVWRKDVGVSLALGGADCLAEASDDLRDLIDRRRRDRPAGGEPDGLVAAATRMLGIEAHRRGDRPEARRLLDDVTRTSLRDSFDPHTAHHTDLLAARQRPGGDDSATRVYVDLSIEDRYGAVTSPPPLPGFLVTRKPTTKWSSAGSEGVGVLLDATSFAGQNVVEASVLLSASDGLSERVDVNALDVFGEGDAEERPLALAMLARTVPSSQRSPMPLAGLWRAETTAELRSSLADSGIDLDGSADFAPVSTVSAVQRAEQAAPYEAPAGPGVAVGLNSVASLITTICHLIRRCDEAPADVATTPLPGTDGKLPQTGCGAPSMSHGA